MEQIKQIALDALKLQNKAGMEYAFNRIIALCNSPVVLNSEPEPEKKEPSLLKKIARGGK